MLKLRLDIDENLFIEKLTAILEVGGVDLHNAISTVVKSGISRELEHLAQCGCMDYGFSNGSQPRMISLKQAFEHGGFDFWYLDIKTDFRPGVILSEQDVILPSVMQWLPIEYGGGVKKRFKFKHTKMKTRERYGIQILHPRVPAHLLAPVLLRLAGKCPCASKHLVPTPLGVYEWWQSFTCVLCGATYFCECFRTAIEKFCEEANQRKSEYVESGWPHKFLNAVSDIKYRPNICHLCTGTPSNLTYCSPMYGSPIQARYGAYIKKVAIADNLSDRDAENKIRDFLGVPRLGEGWINETQLFKLVSLFFANHDVVREASPDWLGNQRFDIFIPALSLAIEYQGEQHFRPVERFGGDEGFRETRLRDNRKRILCKRNGVKLVYFTHSEELSVEAVEKKLKRFRPSIG